MRTTKKYVEVSRS